MKFRPFALNFFVFFKIPSAYLSGVRVKAVSKERVVVTVRHRWINQNPFKSMYWATQGMASELATGILLMQEIAASGEKISLLVTEQKGTFKKKAKGTVTFSADKTPALCEGLQKTIATGEGQQVVLHAEGVDESGAVVSVFEYQWSVKRKEQMF